VNDRTEFADGQRVRFVDEPLEGYSEVFTVVSSRPVGDGSSGIRSYTFLDDAHPGADIRTYGSELEAVSDDK